MAKQRIATYLHDAIANGFKHIRRRFSNLAELNANFHAQRSWIFETIKKKADYKRRLVRVLEVLKLHSCKHLGISWLTENHICAAYAEQFRETLSKRSVSTYIEHLRKIGFISTIPTKRKDGKQSANIVVMERLKKTTGEVYPQGSVEASEHGFDASGTNNQEDTPNAAKKGQEEPELAHKNRQNLHTIKTIPFAKTTDKDLNKRITNKRKNKTDHQEKNQSKQNRLLNFVPRWFKDKITCCATDAKSVYEYWKVAKHITEYEFSNRIENEDKQEVIGCAIKEYYHAAKAASKGKFVMHNPYGFFHTVLQTEASAHTRRSAQRTSSSFFNWLEA